MVEENAIRADLSPWGTGADRADRRDQGHFANVEAAIDALYASFSATAAIACAPSPIWPRNSTAT